jgi:hypothetical protein
VRSHLKNHGRQKVQNPNFQDEKLKIQQNNGCSQRGCLMIHYR